MVSSGLQLVPYQYYRAPPWIGCNGAASILERRGDLCVYAVILPAAVLLIHEARMDQSRSIGKIDLYMRPLQPRGQADGREGVGGRSDIVSRRPIEESAQRQAGNGAPRCRQRQPAEIDIEVVHIGGQQLVLLESTHPGDAANLERMQIGDACARALQGRARIQLERRSGNLPEVMDLAGPKEILLIGQRVRHRS